MERTETPESIAAACRAVDKLITDVHALKNSNPTLIDQFAMAAMHGILANFQLASLMQKEGMDGDTPLHKVIASASYQFAKSMVEERECQ